MINFYYLALSVSFEYVCYGSTSITMLFNLLARGSTLTLRALSQEIYIFLSLEVVSRYRDPQLQVTKN